MDPEHADQERCTIDGSGEIPSLYIWVAYTAFETFRYLHGVLIFENSNLGGIATGIGLGGIIASAFEAGILFGILSFVHMGDGDEG